MNQTVVKYGKNCLVTGASSGIGQAYAEKFAELGHDIILSARSVDKLEKIKTDLEKKYSIKAYVFAKDLSVTGAAEELAGEIQELNLDVHILINNAGVGQVGTFMSMKSHEIAGMMELNCTNPAKLAHIFGQKMLERRSGAIIFLASIVAYQATPWMSLYGATKGFNLLLGEALCHELRDAGIDVLSVSPGSTKTNFSDTAGLDPKIKELPGRSSMQVVDTTISALGKQQSVVDGSMNALLVFLNRFLPRFLPVKVYQRVYKKLEWKS